MSENEYTTLTIEKDALKVFRAMKRADETNTEALHRMCAEALIYRTEDIDTKPRWCDICGRGYPAKDELPEDVETEVQARSGGVGAILVCEKCDPEIAGDKQ